MFNLLLCFVLLTASSYGDLLAQERSRGATLKPISACCDIPELGEVKPLTECSNPKLLGPCNDVQCVFEKSGFLVDKNTLNKDVYKRHLRKWAEEKQEWTDAVERAITDCVDKDLRQYLDYPCRAYDVFTCTGIAILKVISAQERRGPPHYQLPEQCQRPPQGVKERPHECCKIPKFFEDADFEACGFKKLDEGDTPMGMGPPDCTKQLCMMKKYNLVKGEDLDYEALNKFMDKWATTNPDFKDSVSIAKERCIGKPLPGPPRECEANKIIFCVSSTLIEECPKWDETDGCQKLKDHIKECAPYFHPKQ